MVANETSLLNERQKRFERNPGGAVYGAILVTATIAATSHHEDRAWVVLAEAVSTLLVFWLAHFHSAVIGQRFEDPSQPLGRVVRDTCVHELPMLEVAIVPCGLLAAASLKLLDTRFAVLLGLWTGVVELFGVGVARGRRTEHSVLRSIGTGLFYALVGSVLVALKAIIH